MFHLFEKNSMLKIVKQTKLFIPTDLKHNEIVIYNYQVVYSCTDLWETQHQQVIMPAIQLDSPTTCQGCKVWEAGVRGGEGEGGCLANSLLIN